MKEGRQRAAKKQPSPRPTTKKPKLLVPIIAPGQSGLLSREHLPRGRWRDFFSSLA